MPEEIIVNIKKTTSGFGIVSLVFGCVAGLGCWIPLLGLLSVPAAILGAAFGTIGLFASLISKRTYLSLPIAGLTVSVISFFITTAVFAATANTIASVGQRDNEEKKSHQAVSIAPSQPRNAPVTTISKEETVKDDDQIIKVSKPIFGIYLGEKISELKERFKLEPMAIEKDNDSPTQQWVIKSNNSNIFAITIDEFDGYVYDITLLFKDASKTNFDAIKNQLIQTYGQEVKLGYAGIVFGGHRAAFAPVIDGVKIYILLQQQEEMNGVSALGMLYKHEPLSDKLDNEIQKRKMAKVQNDL